ncbi:MAG: flagellar hook-length control protein FliK [bacterium]|nr:flagellar hook-length control protein FliK [bacterium]
MNVTSLHTSVLSAGKPAGESLFKGLSGSKSTDWFGLAGIDLSGLFGSQFASLLASANANAVTPAATSASNGDPQASLAQLVSQGTPLSTVARTIAQRVGDSVRSLLTGKLPQHDLDRISSKLTQALANALAPPGTAPPTATQQVAALAQRLTDLVNALARGDGNGAGQQNEISGTLLDAISAKEPPAQQKTNGTSSQLEVSSLARSLMASAAAALQSQPPSAPSPGSPQQSTPPSNTLATVSHAHLAGYSNASAITIANAPDLLARMLVRAAGAARGTDAQASAPAANATLPTDRGAQSPSAIAARLVATLSSAAATAASSGSSGSNAGGGAFAHDHAASPFDRPQSTLSPAAQTNAPVVAAPTTTLHTIVQQLHDSQNLAAKADAEAVIAQLVKGMTMRTNAQGNSEIRLRLQPENLGDVTMKITVQGSQISASVVAQNADVKSALLGNQQHLARALAESGLTLAGFSVDVSGGDAGRDQNRDRTSGFGRRYTVHELPGAAHDESPTLAAIGPPLVSGTGLELFSYLA